MNSAIYPLMKYSRSKHIRACWACFCVLFILFTPAYGQQLRVITEQNPPINYQEEGQARGLTTEMVQALLKEARLEVGIEFLPWNRAYAIALKNPNVVLFTVGRTQVREQQFDWIFKAGRSDLWLYRMAYRTDVQPTTLDEAKSYKVGTGATEDLTTRELLNRGFKLTNGLEPLQSPDPMFKNLQKLRMGRIDLVIGDDYSIPYVMKKIGMKVGDIVRVLPVAQDQAGSWVVISKGSDPDLVHRIKVAAEQLEKSGLFAAILARYKPSTD